MKTKKGKSEIINNNSIMITYNNNNTNKPAAKPHALAFLKTRGKRYCSHVWAEVVQSLP